MKVAEHIPKEFEHVYIDNLVRHAKEGIILSWSKVGQGGHSHVNNQNLVNYFNLIMLNQLWRVNVLSMTKKIVKC